MEYSTTTSPLSFRRSAQVVLLSSWCDRLELQRNRNARFTVCAWKLFGGKWEPWNTCKGFATPLQVMSAIDELADLLGVNVDYADALPLIASIDWVTAAVIAEKIGHDVSALDEFAILTKQRSFRPFGKVKVGVEWGYDIHTIAMPFERWLRVLGGELYTKSEPYTYEGKVFNAQWYFNCQQLQVTYGDAGTGWEGSLDALDLLDGPHVDGVDIAKLAIKASSIDTQK